MQLKLLGVFHWIYKLSQQYFQWKTSVKHSVLNSGVLVLFPLQIKSLWNVKSQQVFRAVFCSASQRAGVILGQELNSQVPWNMLMARCATWYFFSSETLTLQCTKYWVPKIWELRFLSELTILGTSNTSELTTGMWLIAAGETFMNAWLAFFMVTNRKVFNVTQWGL